VADIAPVVLTRFERLVNLQRTKEYIAIIKQVLARQKPLEFHGEFYDIPYAGPDASGLGKPLRSIAHGNPCLSTPPRSPGRSANGG